MGEDFIEAHHTKPVSEMKDEEKTIKDRISEFKKIFDGSEKLQSFSSNVVKTVVDKVILGGYDKDGNPEPYMLTFIFKTGFQSKIDVPNPKGRKKSKSEDKKCSCQAGQAR